MIHDFAPFRAFGNPVRANKIPALGNVPMLSFRFQLLQ